LGLLPSIKWILFYFEIFITVTAALTGLDPEELKQSKTVQSPLKPICFAHKTHFWKTDINESEIEINV
jgi:hypothetical protein